MVNQFSNGGQAGHGQAALQVLPDFFQFLFGRSALLALAAWTLLCFLLLRGWDDVRPRRKGAGIPPGLSLAAWAVGPLSSPTWSHKPLPGYSRTRRTSRSRFPPPTCWLRADTRAFSGRAAGVFQATVAAGLAVVSLAYLLFSMDYYTTPTKEQVREAAAYVAAHRDDGTLIVRCDANDRLDYYLAAGDSVQACTAKDVTKVQSRVKEEHYDEVFHLISRPEPDQEMISMLQRDFQPIHCERFYGAAVVTYKGGQHPSAGPPQPEPPSSLPTQE